MTDVFCELTDCKNNERRLCKKSRIYVDDICPGNEGAFCSDYKCYAESEDYQNEYWIACKDNVEKICRKKRKGKKIEAHGMVFYTSDDDREPQFCGLTEERTGVKTCTLDRLDECINVIKKELLKHPNVMDFKPKEG